MVFKSQREHAPLLDTKFATTCMRFQYLSSPIDWSANTNDEEQHEIWESVIVVMYLARLHAHIYAPDQCRLSNLSIAPAMDFK